MPVGANLGLKREALDYRLRILGRTLVAYSGGVDSAFLAWASHQVLGNELFAVMESFRLAHDFQSIAYGVNADDQGDFRPGQAAAKQHHVAAPLLDAKLTKQEIRELARAAGLHVWEKPASACLWSRVEYC